MSDMLTNIVEAYSGVIGEATRVALIQSLRDREDHMADLIREAGQQFGLFPEIVAKVLQDVGMGTPKSPEEQEYINQQFAFLMQRMREEWERQQREGN